MFYIGLYNWGEPLLHRDLPTFIRKAKERQICVEIHTNLSLNLKDAYLEDLLSSGVDVIAASIDGFSQETYQTYRRGGNFEVAKTNIERLAAIRYRLNLQTEIIWNFLVFRFNEHELSAVRRYCDKLGVVFNRREAYVRGDPDWLPSYRQREAGHLQQRLATNNATAKAEPSKAQLARRVQPCNWHFICSAVNSNGSVSPCCAVQEEQHDFGFVWPGQTSFGDIWNNSLFRKSRGAFANRPVPGLEQVDTLCQRCPYGSDVQGMYSSMNAMVIDSFHRAFDGKDPWLEEGFRRLSDREAFLTSTTQSMSKVDISPWSRTGSPCQPALLRQYHMSGLQRGLNNRLRAHVVRLLNRFPALYARVYIVRYEVGKLLQRLQARYPL